MNILRKVHKNVSINLKIVRNFAAYDPYYLLGVKRQADYKEIKQVYYKLAAEYHPDRNKSQDAAKQFLLIKEAFEQIKQHKGKAVKMDSYDKQDKTRKRYQSVRPNSEDYTEDYRDEEKEMNQDNYEEYMHRTSDSEEFADLKDSLNTMHNINDIKLRVEDVDLPDASSRFNLDEKQVKLKNFSDGSYLFLAFVGIMFGVGFYFINSTHNKIVADKYNNMLLNMLNRRDFKEAVEEDEDILKDVSTDLQQRKEYKTFVQKVEEQKQKSEKIKQRSVPIIRDFVSASSIKDEDDDDDL